jgi:hypothetical protein
MGAKSKSGKLETKKASRKREASLERLALCASETQIAAVVVVTTTGGVVVVTVPPPQPPVPDELPLEPLEPPPQPPWPPWPLWPREEPPLHGFFLDGAFLPPQPLPPETSSISLSVKTRISIS